MIRSFAPAHDSPAIPDTHPASVATRRTGVPGWLTHRRAALAVLLLLAATTLLLFDRPLVRGDGVAYFAWVDTLIGDGDIELQNQVERFASVNSYQIAWSAQGQRLAIVFPFGIAVLQAPFYLLGRLSESLGLLNVNANYFRTMQGLPLAYSFWLMVGANIMALGTIVLLWDLAARLVGDWLAVVVAFAVFIGTPLWYYSTIDPLNSHNGAAFTYTVVVWLVLTLARPGQASIIGRLAARLMPAGASITRAGIARETASSWRHWLLLGICAGLTVLTRWQMLVAIVPLALLLWGHPLPKLLLALLAAVVVLLPLPLVWQAMFGAPFVVPYAEVEGTAFLQAQNQWWPVLLATVLHAPVTVVLLPAVIVLLRCNLLLALAISGAVVLQLLVNGAALDWYAGNSFSMRRMSELAVLVALGAAVVLAWLSGVLPVDGYRIVVAVATIVFVLYTALMIASFLHYTWTNQQGQTIATPQTMLRHFLDDPNHWQRLRAVIAAHTGPWAWAQPGP